MNLPKTYDPKKVEGRIYKLWEKSGFFNPDKLPKRHKKPFSMVFPPPNVTGTLHIGQAYEGTLQDIIVRFERMRGQKTLWIPGTDHAAIATQAKVEKKIYDEEGKTRHDLGREEFLRRVKKFALDNQRTILSQLRKLGLSLDWSRLAFTLDKERSIAVYTAFKRMYEAGLIYRGNRIVNWDPKLKTTTSDDEIEWKEVKEPLYYLKYGPFTIATARPETKFGDKYVVMHPEDKRYANYRHGQQIEVEWINGRVIATVIKDDAVDQEFGTGVMTITPWHDTTDFEIAQRHNLSMEQIIDFSGKLLPIAGEFNGQHIKKARPLIVAELKNKGLLERVDENYIHRVAVNSRGGEIIEPQIMKQWFVDVNKKFAFGQNTRPSKIRSIKNGENVSLREIMRRLVESREIKILPRQFEKRYFHWVNNLHDWCISRQIWFGHRIPVWYKEGEIKVSFSSPGRGWEQDPDTLDTWFSSGLWTFSTLGWPKDTKDLKIYHPTDLMNPGYEILYLWVSRMIFLSGFLLGEVPFKTALMHGIVRDKQGRKFSKSSGIGGDPREVIDLYGTDALRMALIAGVAIGNDPTFGMEKVKAYRNFANKIWNATRFLLQEIANEKRKAKSAKQNRKGKTELLKLNKLVKETTQDIENFRFHHAAERLYHFFWHYYADKVIEDYKKGLVSKATLFAFQETLIKLLHPFMPFVTEEIYQKLPLQNKKKCLMVENWPPSR